MFLRDAWLSKLPNTPAGTWCGPNIVVWKPLTSWFCVQGRHSQSFQWQNVTNKLQRSPLTQSYLKKLMSNTVFRPQCNKSPIARHTTSSRDCRAAVQSCPHHYIRSHYCWFGWGPRGWFFTSQFSLYQLSASYFRLFTLLNSNFLKFTIESWPIYKISF